MSKNSTPFIPFALPFIEEDEIAAVAETMRSGWLTTGPRTKEFEIQFAKVVGSNHALAVNSATSGLHLALEAVGVKADDIVLMPTWTFTATAEVTRYLGAHPKFVDVNPQTLNISISDLEQKIHNVKKEFGDKLKAIIPVHFAGQACEMNEIIDLAKDHSLYVIEDAAHSFPTKVNSKSVDSSEVCSRTIGSVGHITSFSFYVTKTLATGEGGMITTNCPKLTDRMKLMRLHGINRDVWNRYTSNKPSWYYEVVAPGFKYNLTDIASSIGICQLNKSEKLRVKREKIANEYNAAFSKISMVEVPSISASSELHAWHLYVLRLNLEQLSIGRDEFIEKMSQMGIGCSVHFIPLHLQPYWKDRYQLNSKDFPVASYEYERCVSLPIYPGLDEIAITRIIDAVTSILSQHKR